jgi:hypothetical protein
MTGRLHPIISPERTAANRGRRPPLPIGCAAVTCPVRGVVVLASIGLLIGGLAACGGGSDESAVIESLPVQPGPAPAAPGSIERRLSRAGYHVERGSVPPDLAGGRVFLTTGVGPMIVYIVGFRTAPQATAYGQAVTQTARAAPKQVVARRVGKNVYSGVVAERPDAVAPVAPLLEAVRAAEGKKARLIRLSPR